LRVGVIHQRIAIMGSWKLQLHENYALFQDKKMADTSTAEKERG
jgi:hypothetical protein